MANRLKRVVSTVLCATVMLTMTVVPGAVFAQTDVDSSEQPETTAQTENQNTPPENEAGKVTQETKQTPEPSQETAKAPAKQQNAAARPQAAMASYSFDDVRVSITPSNKRQDNTVTSCKGTVKLKAVLVNAFEGKKYYYQWYKEDITGAGPISGEDQREYIPTDSGTYYVTAVEDQVASTLKTSEKITVNLLDHEVEAMGVKDATCTTDGHEEYWQCSICNMLFTDRDGKNPTTADQVRIPAAHNMTKTEAKAATCTAPGNNEYYTCEKCKKVFADEAGKTETTVEAQTISAKGHDMRKTEAKAATCTDPGNHEYYTCNTCGKIFKDQEGNTETTVEERMISEEGHNLTKHEAKDSTCTDSGNLEYWTCSKCNKIFADADAKKEFADADAVILPANGHKFGEWTVRKPAGIGTEGLKERICEKCRCTETAAIPALGANKADLNNKAELAQKTAEKKTDESAKTGDDSSIALYVMLALLAAGGACGAVYRRKLNG